MKYNIYPASACHASILNDILYESWRSCYRGMMDDTFLDAMDPQRWTQYFQENLGNSLKGAILEADSQPVGCGTYRPSDYAEDPEGTGEIQSFYFLPSFWGKGLSAPLMQWLLEQMKEDGYRHAALWVLDPNQRARRFYEKMGFICTGNKLYSKLNDQNLLDLRMRKAL